MTDHRNIEVETASAGDREELQALFDECFPGEGSFSKWYFDNVWQSSRTLVIRRLGEIVSALQMLPARLELNGQLLEGSYVFAVGTHPHHEGMGYAGVLIRESFERDRGAGRDFSCLIVQQSSLVSYYARFGYEPIFKVQRITLPASRGEGRAEVLDSTHIDAIDAIYRADKADMLFDSRTRQRWEEQMDAYRAYGYYKNNELTSYCFADERMGMVFAAEACGRDARELVMAIAHERGKKECMMLIAPQDGNAEALGCFIPLSDRARALQQAADGCYLNLYYN